MTQLGSPVLPVVWCWTVARRQKASSGLCACGLQNAKEVSRRFRRTPPLPVRDPTSDVLCSVAGLFGPLEHRQIGIGYWPNQWYLNYCCYIARRREECARSSVGATNCFVRFNARTSIRETTALLIFRCLYIHRVRWGVLRACNAPCIRLSMSWSITSLIGS